MISRKGSYRDADKTGAANMVTAAANQGGTAYELNRYRFSGILHRFFQSNV
jgi:hypothetical protein